MNYEQHKAETEAYAAEIERQLPELRERVAQSLVKDLHLFFAPSHGFDGKSCRESYGWCWQHMAKALPPRPARASVSLPAELVKHEDTD